MSISGSRFLHSDGSVYRIIDTRIWDRICKLAPDIEPMMREEGLIGPPPIMLTDYMFAALLTSFANPLRREILASLLLDCVCEKLDREASKTKEGGAV